jgi:hypothetical protein
LVAEVIEMAKLVNLTPHPITLFLKDGRVIFLPSEGVARVREVREDAGELELEDGITVPLCRKFLSGEVEGLPEPQEGTVYIVSLLAAQRAWELGRTDVVAPGDYVRDGEGRIIGITSLQVKP